METPDRRALPLRTPNSLPSRSLGSLPLRMLAGAVAGALLCLSMPPWGWWPLAPIGVAVWLAALADASRWHRFLLSWVVGVVWLGASNLWMWNLTAPGYVVGTLIGWGPMTGVVGLVCPPDRRRLVVLPAALICFEWFHSHAPFGGVPVSMLAMSQTRAPLLPIATIGGGLLLTGAIAATGSVLYLVVAEVARRDGGRPGWWRAPVTVVVAIALLAGAGAMWPRGTSSESVRVAIVQGGGEQTTRFTSEAAPEVFARHLALTQELEPGDAEVVLWPENVINVNGRFEDSPWADLVAEEARRLDATLLVGVVEDAPGDPDAFMNYEIVVLPDGSFGDRYDKHRRVPFGEYVPLRSFFERFAGDTLPRRDQVPGTEPAVLDTPSGPFATVISWEIFFARRVREGVREGGEIVVNPTNGSSFWLTQVQTQQIASSILRAVESGRWVLQAAPTGFSAVVDDTGTVLQRTNVSEAAVLSAEVPRLGGTTPAQALGDVPALTVALAGFVLAAGVTRRGRSRPNNARTSSARPTSARPTNGRPTNSNEDPDRIENHADI